jgi:hypothetical protein
VSHLLKNNLKKYFLIFKIFIIISLLFLFYNGFINYLGSKYLFTAFSIINVYLIFFAFRKKAFFFETFFGILLFLGFWFKFTIIISFTDGIFKEGVGNFDYSPENFDYGLLISSIGIIPLIIVGHLREALFYYPSKINLTSIKKNFLSDNRKNILLVFLIFIILISSLNGYFKVYQKGLIPLQEINFFISGSIKWLLLFGLSSISCILIFLEIRYFKKIFNLTIVIFLFENFLSSVSMISRGMIFNSLSIIYGIYKFSKKTGKSLNIKIFIKMIMVCGVLFYMSVILVNEIRAEYFYIGKSRVDTQKKINLSEDKKFFNFLNYNSEFFYIATNRWVGIDAIFAVAQNKDKLGRPLLRDAFKEKFQKELPTFYERTFYLNDTNNSAIDIHKNAKGNTLTGIIAFLFYSGSLIFLFMSMLVLMIFANILEFILYKISGKNIIFCSLIGQIVAFRFIHFGYLPSQSYLLFGSIFLTILAVYVFNIFIKK